jgi:transposase
MRKQASRLRETGQRGLGFDVVERAAEPGAKRFEMPRRATLAFGDGLLSRYLETAGEKWVLELVKFLGEFDWKPFEEKYDGQKGRVPIHPQVLLGLILYGIWAGRSTLREMEALARLDLGAMYVCGGIQPDFTTLARFLGRHEQYLSQGFFEELTKKLFARLRVKPRNIAVDGTVIEAVSSRHSMLKAEAARAAADAARAEAEKVPSDAAAQRRAEAAETAAAAVEFRQAKLNAEGKKGEPRVAPAEPESVMQPRKDGAMRPGFVSSVAVAEDTGLITGIDVRGSGETQAVPSLVAQHRRTTGVDVERMLADGNYAKAEVLRLALEANINFLAPAGRGRDLTRRGNDGKLSKSDFKYDESSDSYRCPDGRTLHFRWVDKSREEKPRVYRGDCSGCPLREKCTSGKGDRTISRFAGDELKEALHHVMQQPEARRDHARRNQVERVFASLKTILGFTRFTRRGQAKALMEMSLHCAVLNLRRALVGLAAVFFALARPKLPVVRLAQYAAP